MIDCAKCGDPLMSNVERCPKCGTEVGGRGGPISATDRAATSDVAFERTLLVGGLLCAFQIVKIFSSRDAASWVQVARAVIGIVGAVFLYTYHAKDFSSLSASAKRALRVAYGVAIVLLIAVWLS